MCLGHIHPFTAPGAPKTRLNIYQVAEVEEVKPAGSVSNLFSAWKAAEQAGLKRIGDIFIHAMVKPGAAILARSTDPDDDIFRDPIFYRHIKLSNIESIFWWPQSGLDTVIPQNKVSFV